MEGFNQCSKGHFYKEDKASCPYYHLRFNRKLNKSDKTYLSRF